MNFRRIHPTDFPQILALQNKNLLTNLTDTEQTDGFLSTAFTSADFKKMDQDLCVTVCEDAGQICGYLCATTLEFNKNFPIQAVMLERLAHLTYQDKPLTAYQGFIASPLCIEKNYRGTHVLPGLCSKILELIPLRYELAVTLIAANNIRSQQAAKKIGFIPIDQFTIKEATFSILICELVNLRSH